jgi:hypothetical protein
MTDTEERILFKMITEIYHHLGLDGQLPLSLNHIQEEAKNNILKWKDKKLRRNYVREKSP